MMLHLEGFAAGGKIPDAVRNDEDVIVRPCTAANACGSTMGRMILFHHVYELSLMDPVDRPGAAIARR